MIPQNLKAGFAEAVPKILATGENLVAFSEAYTEQWSRDWNEMLKTYVDVFRGFSWMGVALTSSHLRYFTWKNEVVKVGLLKKETHVLPEIGWSHSVPLAHITSCGSRTFVPQKQPRKNLHKMFGTDVGEVSGVNVQFPNGVFDVASPYNEFAALIKKLESMLAGAAIATQVTSASDAISKLAILKSEGIISEEEFERSKAGFMGSPVEVVETSASLLRQLHSLYKTGVLTESEFNMKKWDILSRAN